MININVRVRAKIQQIIDSNTIRASGDFHSDDLNEDGFLYDINKNFKLTSKEKELETYELLKKLIKSSTVKVIGLFESKEFKQSKFIKELFENFEVEKI